MLLRFLFYCFLFSSATSCQSLARLFVDAPMGDVDDVLFSNKLWDALEKEGVVGADSISGPFFISAAPPHGWISDRFYGTLTIDGRRSQFLVKKNYAEEKIPIKQVENDRQRYLHSIAVMFQREPGYDPDNQNWFWAKYKNEKGTLATTNNFLAKVPIAGRVEKGKSVGCIYCHSSAGGSDYVFYPDFEPKTKNYSK